MDISSRQLCVHYGWLEESFWGKLMEDGGVLKFDNNVVMKKWQFYRTSVFATFSNINIHK